MTTTDAVVWGVRVVLWSGVVVCWIYTVRLLNAASKKGNVQ